MHSRFFQLDGEWCLAHIPKKPNGFAVFIIGDKNHFVEESSSFWLQNSGRYQIIEYLLSEGYTVFYSNLYGRNWGSPPAVSLAVRLYHIMMKTEILNHRIHILAEGMGALIALQLMNENVVDVRSVAMMNPCISLKRHLEDEKEHKFFYKSLVQELRNAYGINHSEKKNLSDTLPSIELSLENPVKIWQTTTNYSFNPNRHSRFYEEYRQEKNSPIILTYYLSDKRFSIGQSICKFYNENENDL
ncbi:alpha/beta fold hydrolase [Litchfieldia salsa]|uniref:Alpha/beta hydrolase n=1 Tax=Litchfieldia salsa TaxID=930152 RepID=A0A1H0S8I0_9BACI|nr:hypothetical protein [Litchfieldia salsa]SDP37528.1 hypothetical protein SAMN05216565_102575 [Litchfieldia salsa]